MNLFKLMRPSSVAAGATGVIYGMLILLSSCAQAGEVIQPKIGDTQSASVVGISPTAKLVQKLEKQVEQDPSSVTTRDRLGEAYMQNGRETGDLSWYKKGDEMFKAALALDAHNSVTLHDLAWSCTIHHHFKEAIDYAQEAVKINSSDHIAYGLISDSYFELGDYDKALEASQKMIDIRPDLSSYSRGAQLRWTYGNTRGATYLMLKAINAGGPNAENTAWCRVQLADIYFKTGSLVAAEQQYNIALQQIPGYRHALVGLGRVRAVQGNLNEAIRLFNQATLGPTQITYVVELGDLYKKAGKNEDAEKQYARVDGLAKEHLAYGIEGDELVLAMFYLDHDRNLDKALSMADAEVKEGHKSVQAYSTQAWAYYKLKRYEEASQTINNAMRTNIRDATLFYRAGKIYQALGDQKKAKNYMLMAVSLNPSFHIFYADDAISSMKYAVNGKQQ